MQVPTLPLPVILKAVEEMADVDDLIQKILNLKREQANVTGIAMLR